ncbi:hypothetical protein HK103_002096 [Boothiomyces macroporosus]|uniref:SnoaL-like domain-containing protein n=1 Tax=Boothiomyces macroporosus TaxID=261099 RepID=A0AAD5Y9L0_9FUNG|nr:hypothetical protein HK103_002096 [Boothiomyces macroporosus]
MSHSKALQDWHRVVFQQDLQTLRSLLDENVTFHTPLYLKPRVGRDIVTAVLAAAISNFQDFKYFREWITPDGLNWALEFEANVEERKIKGVDLIRWEIKNGEWKIVEFEVMLRPVKQLVRFGQLQASKIPEVIKQMGFKVKL